MMGGEEWGWRSATLTPWCVLQVWRVKHAASERLLCCTLFSFSTCSGKKNGCSVLHALADLHYAPTLAAPQYKSGLRRIAAHRLTALHCYRIIQELAERKRQREWGVCTLSPGETGAKEEASLDEWVTAAKKKAPKHLQNTSAKEARARSLYCLSPHPPKYCKPTASKQASEYLTLPLRDNSSLHYHSRRLSKKAW